MIKRTLSLLLLFGLFSAEMVLSATYRFAPLPMQDPERVVREIQPMLQYLTDQTGLSFQIVYTESYQDLIDRFQAGEVDLTYLGPLPYVELSSRYPHVDPLVVFREPDGEALYTCALVTFAGAPIAQGAWSQQTFALTQPLSTCGFLATSHLLERLGVSLGEMEYCYVNRHDEVALSVIRGDFSVGGLKTQIARNYVHLGLEVVEQTDYFPGFALVANTTTLSVEHQRLIQETLLAVQPIDQPEQAAIVAGWGPSLRYGTAIVMDENYAPVRALRSETPIPMECQQP